MSDIGWEATGALRNTSRNVKGAGMKRVGLICRQKRDRERWADWGQRELRGRAFEWSPGPGGRLTAREAHRGRSGHTDLCVGLFVKFVILNSNSLVWLFFLYELLVHTSTSTAYWGNAMGMA